MKQISGVRIFVAFLASILAATLVTGVGPAVAQDTPTCDGLPATIVGTEGDDDIDGTVGDDVIAGLAGDDKIDGKGGNDTVCGGTGDDEIKTGDGDDRLFGGDGDDKIDAGHGNNVIDAGDGVNEIKAGDGDDQITAGSGDDKIEAKDGTNTISAGAGVNEITAGDGDDQITAGDGDDKIDAKNGTNVIDAGDGINEIKTGDGDDSVTTGSGDDKIEVGKGDNRVVSGGGDDLVKTEDGVDLVDAGVGDDKIETGKGDDTVDAGPGDDEVKAGEGADTIRGGDGDDVIKGEKGDDVLDGGNDTDLVDGGDDTDTCDDAETTKDCETITNNGEPDDEIELPTVLELSLTPILDGQVSGVVSVSVSREDRDPSDVVTLIVSGQRVGDFVISEGTVWDTTGFAGLVNVSVIGIDADGSTYGSNTISVSVFDESDPDSDGVSQELESLAGTDPGLADTDGDGLFDLFEIVTDGLDPLVADTDVNADPDGDGIPTINEQDLGTNPTLADTDSDGINDQEEILQGLFPTEPDTDADGLLDGDEIAGGLNPFVQDSNGDGVLDNQEPLVVTVEDNGVVAELRGTGNLASGFSATEIDDVSVFGSPLSPVFQLSVAPGGVLESASVSLPFDLGVAENPVVVRWNRDLHMWIPASNPTEQVLIDGRLSAEVTGFSEYSVVELRDIQDAILGPACFVAAEPDTIRLQTVNPTSAAEAGVVFENLIWFAEVTPVGDGFDSEGFRQPNGNATSLGDDRQPSRAGNIVVVSSSGSTQGFNANGDVLWEIPGFRSTLATSADVAVFENFGLPATTDIRETSNGDLRFTLIGEAVGVDGERDLVVVSERLDSPGVQLYRHTGHSLADGSVLWTEVSDLRILTAQFAGNAAILRRGSTFDHVWVPYGSSGFDLASVQVIAGNTGGASAGVAVDNAGNAVAVFREQFGTPGYRFIRISESGTIIESSILPAARDNNAGFVTRSTDVTPGRISIFTDRTTLPTSGGALVGGAFVINVDVNQPLPTTVTTGSTVDTTDTDLDGISDCIETTGVNVGPRFVDSDPGTAESDTDQLTDDEELLVISIDEFIETATSVGVTIPGEVLRLLVPEVRSVVIVRSDPRSPDSDLDGVPDHEELAEGSDPFLPDTDFDGATDRQEISRGTNPAVNENLEGDLRETGAPESDCRGRASLFLQEPILIGTNQILDGCVEFTPITDCQGLLSAGLSDRISDCDPDDPFVLLLAAAASTYSDGLQVLTPDDYGTVGSFAIALRERPTLDRTRIRQPQRTFRPQPRVFDIRTFVFTETIRVYGEELIYDVNFANAPGLALEAAYNNLVSNALESRTSIDERERRNVQQTIRQCTHGVDGSASVAELTRPINFSNEYDTFEGALGREVLSDAGALGFVEKTDGTGDLEHVCEAIPIYAPGELKENFSTGDGASQLNFTTNHIRMALGYTPIPTNDGDRIGPTSTANWEQWNVGVVREPLWSILLRRSDGAPSANNVREWYRRSDLHCGSFFRAQVPDFTVCDEFPFYTTLQGGPFAFRVTNGAGPASLKWVPGDLNPDGREHEGNAQSADIKRFYSQCVDDRDPFFVIPIPDIRPVINLGAPLFIAPGEPLPGGTATAGPLRSRFINCE